jgi:hypothetical protein
VPKKTTILGCGRSLAKSEDGALRLGPVVKGIACISSRAFKAVQHASLWAQDAGRHETNRIVGFALPCLV